MSNTKKIIHKISLLSFFMSSVLLQNTQAIASSQDYTTSSLHAYQVPNIGGVGLIDQYRERMIGENVYRQVQRQMPVIHDIWLEEQLMSVFSHIVGQSQSQQPIALLLIDDAQINAFAVPGGLFAMNTGLILSAKNMGEVAGVMAHEVAHVSQRHYSRSKETFKGQSLLALAGILVGAAVAAKADGEAGTAVMMGTQAALMNKQLSYSRDQEREADRIGMQYLYAAGYDPHHMANFFETMHRQSPQVGFLPEFWLTHPLTSDRMSEARLRANQYPKLSPHLAQSQQHYQQQQHFDLIQLYSGVISKKTSEAQLLALMKQKNSQATLALAAYYVRKNEWQKAEQILKNFQPSVEQQVLHHILQADVWLAQKQGEKAQQLMERLYKIMPEQRAVAYKYAQVLIHNTQGEQALQVLQGFSQKYPRDIRLWQLLQQAHGLSQTEISAIQILRSRAEVEFWSGYEEQGIKSMLHAQRLAKTLGNQSLMYRIDARLKEMQDEYRFRV